MQDERDRVARLRSFLAQDPANGELACELADVLMGEARLDSAQQVLAELPASVQVQAAVQFRLGRCALSRGDYADAEQIYSKLLQRGDDDIGIRHDLAFSQLCQRRPEAAMATASAALERFGPSPELGVVQARAAMMLDDHATAISVLDGVLAQYPDDASALGVRALALLDDGRYDEAKQAASACLVRYPDQHEALLVAGTLSLWSQDADTADALYRIALQRHPNSGRALSGLGQSLMLQNDLIQARQVLDSAVRAMPDHIGTWHALAWTQLLQGDQASAEHSYQSAYALDRNFGDTHGGLALIAALRGEYDEAEQSIKRALRLDPNAVTAKYAQTLVWEARGETDRGEALMAELVNSTGTQVPVREFSQRLKTVLHAHH